MRKEGVELVVLGPGAHMAWLSDTKPHADERPLLLCITDDYAGFLMPALEADSARQHTQLPFHTWSDAEGPAGALAELLAIAKASNSKSIVLDETMRADFCRVGARCVTRGKKAIHCLNHWRSTDEKGCR